MLHHFWPVAGLSILGALRPGMAQSAPGNDAAGRGPVAQAADNPYNLKPFHADFPAELEYPPMSGLEYDRTRRQILETLARNLQGHGRRESWLSATEFFWRAPEDAVDPLIEAMDRALGNPGLADAVKNCVEAMGKMANEAFDAPLQRALQSRQPAVQQAALMALSRSGKVETLRRLEARFAEMDSRSRAAWLQALRVRLGAEGVELLRRQMMADFPVTVRDQVLHETLQLPPAEAAVILRGRWQAAQGEFKAIIAGVLHAVADGAGTAWLQDGLASADLMVLTMAIRHCARGTLGPLREHLLRATTHLRAEVRLEAAKALMRVDGDDVLDVFEVLAAPDEVWEVRALALHELVRRGRPQVVSIMLEELPTATGTRVQLLLNQLTASGDARVVPIMVDRFDKAPEGEGRAFLQALAQNANASATAALCKLFAGPDRIVGRSQATGVLTTRNYIPTLLLNQRGREANVVDAFQALPRGEWRMRALLLPTLTGMASDRDDPVVQQRCVAPVRELLFDRTELPQLRVLALNLLARRWLTIEDVLRLKNQRVDETPGLRVLFGDFLHDAF